MKRALLIGAIASMLLYAGFFVRGLCHEKPKDPVYCLVLIQEPNKPVVAKVMVTKTMKVDLPEGWSFTAWPDGKEFLIKRETPTTITPLP